jgi:peptidoglycan hydrolase-like protein with peptidoglycan-binding domain
MRRLALLCTAAILAVVVILPSTAQAASWPTVREGDRGPNVQTVQYLVTAHGFATTADGIFGPNTATQVRAFQTSKGLTADAIVGPLTWAQLVITVQEGSTGDAVRGAQVQLVKHGYAIGVDGQFGPATASAVRDFEGKVGLTVNGVVEADTWRELTGNSGTGHSLPIPRASAPRSEYDDPHHDYPAIDLQVPTGTDVFAVTGGSAFPIGGTTSSCGLGVQIDGVDGAEYRYCHLSARAMSGRITVAAGAKIGDSGNTGNSTGPHLHLQIRYGGALRCPQPMLLAIYDGAAVPTPNQLPTSGCTN